MGDFLSEHVFSTAHAPFCGVAICLMVIGQVAKTAVWTRYRARQPGRWRHLWWWGYKTLPLHPAAVGALLGLVWVAPEPGLSQMESVCYFASAGAASVFLYQILKGLAKRQGLDLHLPGDSSPPADASPLGDILEPDDESDLTGIPTNPGTPAAHAVRSRHD